MKNSRTIIIIEPSDIVRRGITALLLERSEFNVLYTSPTLDFGQLPGEEADIVLLNPTLLQQKEISNKRLQSFFPGSHVVALLYQYIRQSILQEFDAAIDLAEPEHIILETLQSIPCTGKEAPIGSTEELTEREKEVLIELAAGLTNKEIADKLHISAHTVTTHRKNIIRKTGIHTVAGLTLYAYFNKISAE